MDHSHDLVAFENSYNGLVQRIVNKNVTFVNPTLTALQYMDELLALQHESSSALERAAIERGQIAARADGGRKLRLRQSSRDVREARLRQVLHAVVVDVGNPLMGSCCTQPAD